tara:strand:+ start:828 stop:1391 length:564 start_codon:yes stop_codon:yes gene_type:complete
VVTSLSPPSLVLDIELIPSNSWGNNLRSLLRGCTWDRLRKHTYQLANSKCEVCLSDGLQQGRKHAVECHEIWEYDDINRIQLLKGLVALCPICHQCKHLGRTLGTGAGARAVQHLATVNNMTLDETESYINLAFYIHNLRSHGDAWVLDLNWLLNHDALTEQDVRDLPYNIEGVYLVDPSPTNQQER